MDDTIKIPMLVADDDPDILNYFRAIFKSTPNELYFAQNGLAAIAKAKTHKIDIAFVDIMMPEMDGLETLKQWKKIQPDTHIIMISAYSDGNIVKQAIQMGAYTYLFKPLSKMDIFAVTMKCLKDAGIGQVISFK